MNKNNNDQKFKTLLNDYDYQYEGNILISKGIKGYTSSQIIGRFKDILSAVEFLIPIIHDDEFWNRYNKIMPA